jgi:integrase/recombinase XerD
MEKIILFPVMHRGAEQILIKCSNIKIVNDAIKKIPKAKWSQTHKSWYVPLNKESYTLIHQAVHQIAFLNTDELRSYLLKKKESNR